MAIEDALTIRMVFHLPLRRAKGFLRSLADLLKEGLPMPDPTVLSRRLKRLENLRFRRLVTDEPIHLIIDSTGLRVPVDHLRKPPKRRVWRKLQLGVNAATGEVLPAELANRRTADCARVPGQRMRSRSLPNQRIAVGLACKILNTMTSLGRPGSYRVT